MLHLSVVIPVYGCCEALNELYERLKKTLENISSDFEVIMVNDASPDNAWEVIKELAQKDKRIKGINLSRNFGQHYAIQAGLENAKGEWIVVMDCDLQDQPEEILKLYNKAQEGYDIVFGRRGKRKDKYIKRKTSDLFYKIFSYLTDTKVDSSVANFGIYNIKTIQAVLKMKDSIKYFPTMINWVGFNKILIEVNHSERSNGKSGYSLIDLFSLAFDIIISFSNKPLRIIIKLGFLISLFSTVIGIIILIKYFNNQIVVSGYTSLIVSLWFLSGVVIALLGLLGVYIGKMFDTVKSRPTFIIDEIINF